jgi:HEAT repeat protein
MSPASTDGSFASGNNPTHSARQITESLLRKDLNEAAHALVRELAMACKKMAIYGPGHPLAAKALDKPYLVLNALFHFRRYVNLNVLKGNLYVMNVCLKDTVFNGQILHYLQLLDIAALTFERNTSPKDFAIFIENMVKRDSLYNPSFSIGDYLRENKVGSIEVNSERGYTMFESGKQYRGEFEGDFSLKRFILDQLGTDIRRLARIYGAADADLLSYGVDFDPELVRYMLPERIATVDPRVFRKALLTQVENLNVARSDEPESNQTMDDYLRMFRMVQYHPDREAIVENLDDARENISSSDSNNEEEFSITGAIKTESINRVDKFLENLAGSDAGLVRATEFGEAFYRLLTTGQWTKAEEVIGWLLDQMRSSDSTIRQHALELLLSSVDTISSDRHGALMSMLVTRVSDCVRDKRETFEYSELIRRLFERGLGEGHLGNLAELCSAMSERRRLEHDVTVYDSMAVKKAFEHINRTDVIDRLINHLVKCKNEDSQPIRIVLAAIGSEQVALALASIITHPSRGVRLQSLKVLGELGRASLKVFSRILNNDVYFERPPDRHELTDAKWYVVRNSIFVLGSIGEPDGIMALRLRLGDNDVRVRREIVSALEKIGGEEAVDCLIFMADDRIKEIREAAIIAMSLIGTADHAPLLIDLIQRNRSEALRVVAALGKLGGDDARAFLRQLLEDDSALSELVGGDVSRDDLRVAVVKALGQIGDRDSIECLKQFRSRQSAAQKLFSKNSPVNKAIAEVLSKR